MNLIMTVDGEEPGSGRAATAPSGDLETLFRSRYRPMVRLAHLLLGSNALAEEVVQEVFARWHEKGSWGDNPAAYLRVSVINACRSQKLGAQRARAREDRAAAGSGAVESATSPDTTEISSELLAALDTLPERTKTVLVLRYYEDLDYARIAEVLDCKPATVRSLAHRGLAQLREKVTR